MKVLGLTKDGHKTAYIVQITHDEYSQVMKNAWRSDDLKELKPGEEVCLSTGYDYTTKIESAIAAFTRAHQEFVKVAPIMAEYLVASAKAKEVDA